MSSPVLTMPASAPFAPMRSSALAERPSVTTARETSDAMRSTAEAFVSTASTSCLAAYNASAALAPKFPSPMTTILCMR